MSKIGSGKILPSAFFTHMEATYGKSLGSRVIRAIQQFPEVHSVRVNSTHQGRYLTSDGTPANASEIDTWLRRRQYQSAVLSSPASYRAALSGTVAEVKEDKGRLKMERKRQKQEKKMKRKGEIEDTVVEDDNAIPDNLITQDQLETIPWSVNGRFVKYRMGFHQDPLSQAVGVVYSQDAASQLVLPQLSDNKKATNYTELVEAIKNIQDKPLRVLDLCSAPGGKASLIRQYLHPDSVVVCNDINTSRYYKLMQTVGTQDGCSYILTNTTVHTQASLLPGFFDVILVDVPCTGSAMFRRSDSALAAWNPSLRREVRAIQKELLTAVPKLLKPQGQQQYMTCSFDAAENSSQIGEALVENPALVHSQSLLDSPFSQNEWNLLSADIQVDLTTITGHTALPCNMRVEGGYYAKVGVNHDINLSTTASNNSVTQNNSSKQLVACPTHLSNEFASLLSLLQYDYTTHSIYLQQNHNNDCVKIFAVPTAISTVTCLLSAHVRSMPGSLIGYIYQSMEQVLQSPTLPPITVTNVLRINVNQVDVVHLSRSHALAQLHERETPWLHPLSHFLATQVLKNRYPDSEFHIACLKEAEIQQETSGFGTAENIRESVKHVYNVDLLNCIELPTSLAKYVLAPHTAQDEPLRRILPSDPFPTPPVLRQVEAPIQAYTAVYSDPSRRRVFESQPAYTCSGSARPTLALSDGVPFCWLLREGNEIYSLLPSELQLRSLQDTPILAHFEKT